MSDTASRKRLLPSALALAAAIVLGVLVVPAPASAAPVPADLAVPAQAGPGGTTSLTPVGPCRIFDTRADPDAGRLNASTWRVQVTGRCNIPAGARAAAINITVSDVTSPGYVTAWPSGNALPNVSNINFEMGHTIANSAVVQLSSSGTIDVNSFGSAQIIIDVTGAFVPATSATSGRYVPVSPKRVVDTRSSGQRGSSELLVPLPAGVPADATAVAVTVTAVDAAGYGYLTVYPDGARRPNTSAVNTDTLNRTRANLVIVPVTAGGFRVARFMDTDVLVDVAGWFTGGSAGSGTDGLFVPQSPKRAWDSRQSNDPVHPGGTIEKQLAPAGAAAVVANVTGVDLTGNGFVTVSAAGTPRPNVSSLNYRWRHPVAALTISRTSTRGVAFYSFAGAHLVVDVAGWFLGQPASATAAPAPNPSPPENTPVVFISDSAFAGIRWNGALGYLQGAAFNNRLESCRRLIGSSCRGREGYAPRTAVAELATVPAHSTKVAIIATGYNDWSGSFPWGFQSVMAQARAQGIERVIWLTYRENVGYVSPYGASNRATFAAHNVHLRAMAASGQYPDLVLADWHSFSFARPAWLTSDGVHLTVSGAREAAMYLSRKLAFLERRPCPAGIGGVAAPGGWCADPDLTGPP